ncbi:hypothetical protein ACVTYA_13675 [Enterococcus hirae]
MKMVSLIMNRKKEIFEFYSVNNLELEEIKSVSELITWVEQENARLLDQGERGSAVVVKKNHKGTILYATKIELPVSYETDFDDFLYEFYTKKPVSFDQTILNEEEVTEEESISSIQNEIDYAPVPEIEDIQLEVPNEDSLSHEEILHETERKDQQEEKDWPKEVPELQKILPHSSILETTEAKSFTSVSELRTEEPLPPEGKKPTVIEREVIKPSVSFTAKSFEQRLNAFIDQEIKNIQNEIQMIDTRELIESEISAIIRQEEECMLKLIDQTLSEQRSKAIEEEKLRHQKELETIDARFDQELQKQRMETIKKYEQETRKRIVEEYQRQTEEIERIVQLRISILHERREQLGETFEKSLDTVLNTVQQGNKTSEEDSENLKQTKNGPPLQAECVEEQQVSM